MNAWLKEMQEARADFLKSCEVCDDADEALRAAKAVCEAQLDKMRACIITGIEEWDSIIAAASGDDQAQKRVELWEAFQAWKEEMREKLEASPHDEVRALLAMLDNGA